MAEMPSFPAARAQFFSSIRDGWIVTALVDPYST